MNIIFEFTKKTCIISFRGCERVLNRIRQLRKQKNLSQKEFAKDFNEYISKNKMDITPINFSVVSKWETKKSAPTKATYKALAKYFNVNEIYLRGAYSKDELLLRLQKYYSKYADDNFDITIDTLRNLVYFDVGEVVDEFVISKRLKPWNIKKEAPLLTKEEVADFNYWKKNFNVLFDHAATSWLITKPTLEATEKDIIGALVDALSGEGDNVVLTKRINFLNKHLYYKSRYPIKTFYDFKHPHPLDGKKYYIEDGKHFYFDENDKRHYIDEVQ